MTRWEALVRYDDEIGQAAAKLMPFGDIWVDRLGEAFFALNEDRGYLPNIVERLIEEAKRQTALEEHQRAIEWLRTFSTTKSREETSREALDVLVNAELNGYRVTRDADGTFVATRNTTSSYLRSNADIIRFGGFLKR